MRPLNSLSHPFLNPQWLFLSSSARPGAPKPVVPRPPIRAFSRHAKPHAIPLSTSPLRADFPFPKGPKRPDFSTLPLFLRNRPTAAPQPSNSPYSLCTLCALCGLCLKSCTSTPPPLRGLCDLRVKSCTSTPSWLAIKSLTQQVTSGILRGRPKSYIRRQLELKPILLGYPIAALSGGSAPGSRIPAAQFCCHEISYGGKYDRPYRT